MGFFRNMFDLVRGVGNDLSDKMTDPERAARLIQEDTKSVNKQALQALASAAEQRIMAEKTFNRYKADYAKYEGFAKQAAAQGKEDKARLALVKMHEIKPDLERAEQDLQAAIRDEAEMQNNFKSMEKQRQDNFNRAKKMELRAQASKSQKNVAKLIDKTGMVDGSAASRLDKLERKVEKEEIRNDAQRSVAIGMSYGEDDAFKDLEVKATDSDIDDELAFLMQNGSFKEKAPVAIEEKQSSPLTQPRVEEVEEAVPVHQSEIDKELAELKKQN